MSYNFNTTFDPEFNWQKEYKTKLRKKMIKIFIIFVFVSVFIFLIQKYYFISDKNINLSSIIPDDSRAILHISNSSKIFNTDKNKSKFSQKTIEKISYYLNDIDFTSLFLKNLEDGTYWIEYDNNSQAFLFKLKNSSSIKNRFFEIFKKTENFEYRNKKVYKVHVNWESNKFLPIENNFLYLSYLNDYTLSVSNNEYLMNKIIDKYQDNLKFDYLRSIKDQFNKYFVNYPDIELQINDYNDISNSKSYLRYISFLASDFVNKKFFIKLNNSSKLSELTISSVENVENKLRSQNEINEISKIFGDNFLLYYNNLGSISGVNNLSFGNNLDDYMSVNIGSLYNINLKDEVVNMSKPYSFILYPKNKFVLIGDDYGSISNIYRKILSHYKPLERKMPLPDGSMAIEYYMDLNSINLKTKQDNNLLWYYDDILEKSDFDMVKCSDHYILSNSKNYIYKFCQEKLSIKTIFEEINELFVFNVNNFEDQTNILPFTELFDIKLESINFVNFSHKNRDMQLILQLIY